MVSATNGLCWEFHNIQYRRHGLIRLYDNGFFSEDLGYFLIPCVSRTPILEGKFLSKKSAAYTLANAVNPIRSIFLRLEELRSSGLDSPFRSTDL
jgi:hypothetical protein